VSTHHSTQATLRMLEKAEKEISKLDRNVKGAVWDFLGKFRREPTSPGLQLKQLHGSKLFSARVKDDYRAILAKVKDNVWLLLTVAHRRKSYDDLEKYAERFACEVNSVTGGIEFVDVLAVESSINLKRRASSVAAGSPTLFGTYSAKQLVGLGVAETLIPIIIKLTTEEELLGLIDYAPQLTGEVLLALYDGRSVEQVRAEVVEPQAVQGPVDRDDLVEALARPATQVTTDDEQLQAVLQGDFDRWKVFLHPTQRKLVDREYSGPARVSGGPGTGKTIVALHRVAYLASRVSNDGEKRILLTTYTRNLAVDLRAKLIELAGKDIADQVEVANIDKVARKVVDSAARPGHQRTVLPDTRAINEWRALLQQSGETSWDVDFLADEWSQVILGQALRSFPEYARARRAGRGRPLTRAERMAVWQLAERFTKRMDENGWTTHAATAAQAAQIESERASRITTGDHSTSGHGYRYQHVVVDEAQDLHAAHWKMLRAMVPDGSRNDIFCVGDTHQRIYDNVVSLGSLGINIRGRSAKLTLNYRTTKQILGSALELLHGESYDDLDGGTDTLVGYRSVLRGAEPAQRGFDTLADELDGVAEQVEEWTTSGTPLEAIAVCVPTRDLVERVSARLAIAEVQTVEITPDGPRGRDGVHIGTMHRFKGLEFQRMIIAGASEGLLPRSAIDRRKAADPARYARELRRDRSLLFVAATRARDDLAIFWHGKPSRFLHNI
jgi:superfamily I DNA/RNA helicase/mRNA-degrading endonuclease RelE of RelBE toxin-antitoxin system